jgi:hypothetical protein
MTHEVPVNRPKRQGRARGNPPPSVLGARCSPTGSSARRGKARKSGPHGARAREGGRSGRSLTDACGETPSRRPSSSLGAASISTTRQRRMPRPGRVRSDAVRRSRRLRDGFHGRSPGHSTFKGSPPERSTFEGECTHTNDRMPCPEAEACRDDDVLSGLSP